jgi:hypothetical protein
MNEEFLNKVYNQIISETRIIDNKIHAPFLPSLPFYSFISLFSFFVFHCKDVYSLNKEETYYVWEKYKKGLTTLINDKELV